MLTEQPQGCEVANHVCTQATQIYQKQRVAKALHLLKSINNTCSPTAFGQHTQMMCVYFNISRDLLQIFFHLDWHRGKKFQKLSKKKESDFQCPYGPFMMEHRPIPIS